MGIICVVGKLHQFYFIKNDSIFNFKQLRRLGYKTSKVLIDFKNLNKASFMVLFR
jgi:hypothetical protein